MSGTGALASLEDALVVMGLAQEGRLHSALADAANAARLWLEMARRWRATIAP